MDDSNEARYSADTFPFVSELVRTVDRLREQILRHEETTSSRLDDLLEAIAALARECQDRRAPAALPRMWFGRGRYRPPQGGQDRVEAPPQESRAPDSRATVVAFCLQPFQVYIDYMPVRTWQGNRCQEIMRLLLTQYPAPVRQDVLIETFWSGVDPEAARRSLHQAVYRLRETLRAVPGAEKLIHYERGLYRLHAEAEVWTDVQEFEHLVQHADRSQAAGDIDEAVESLASAETLYIDDFMQEFPYDDWCRDRRERLRQMYADVVTRLVDYHNRRGDHFSSIGLCRRLLARDPTNEAMYRRLMESHLAEGNLHLVAATFRRCQVELARELGVEPDRETTRIFEQIAVRQRSSPHE